MDIKSQATTITRMLAAAVLLSLTLVAGPANAGHYAYKGHRSAAPVYGYARVPVYDYARVLSAEPIIRYVTVTTPLQECWDETEYYTVDARPSGVGVKTVLGAIIGGVVGHQFGGGRGKDAATVAGTLLGATIANDVARRNAGYASIERSRQVTRCETRYQSHEEERIDGYRVIYAYSGQKYSTRTPYDPGKRLRIKVDVRPAL